VAAVQLLNNFNALAYPAAYWLFCRVLHGRLGHFPRKIAKLLFLSDQRIGNFVVVGELRKFPELDCEYTAEAANQQMKKLIDAPCPTLHAS